MKKLVTINVDAEPFNDFVKMVGRGNISKVMNDHISNYVGLKADNLVEDLIKFKDKLKELEEQRRNITEEVTKVKSIISELETRKQKDEDEKMRIAKEVKERSESCINCGRLLNDRENYTFPLGKVCRGCFLNAHGDDTSRWGKL